MQTITPRQRLGVIVYFFVKYDMVLKEKLMLKPFGLVFFGCTCLMANPIFSISNTLDDGHVKPGGNPNWNVQLPLDPRNGTGIPLQNLLQQNPQNLFAFTTQTDSGPRDLIGYFTPDPWVTVVWTTPDTGWRVDVPEADFNRPSVRPPPGVLPPVHPPVVPPLVLPPSAEEVPEPRFFYGVAMTILFFALTRRWRGKQRRT